MALPDDRQNRTELFLGAIAGDGSTPPEDAHTRLERYLAYFAGAADSKPDTPYTRLERFLDAIEPGIPPRPTPPEEYVEIDGIKGDGSTGYIRLTDVYPTPLFKIRTKYITPSDITSVIKVIAASRDASDTPTKWFNFQTNQNGKASVLVGTENQTGYYTADVLQPDTEYEFSVDRESMIVDTETVTIGSTGSINLMPITVLAREYVASPMFRSFSDGIITDYEDSYGRYATVKRISDGVLGLYNVDRMIFYPGTGGLTEYTKPVFASASKVREQKASAFTEILNQMEKRRNDDHVL